MKQIKDFPNYAVDKEGNVYNIKKGKKLKNILDTNGYEYVNLYYTKYDCKKMAVHRLVANAYLPKEDNKNIINHKDFNRSNNNVENLEWCTQQYNIKYSYDAGRLKSKVLHKPKQIIDETTGIVYHSINEAARQLGLDGSAITKVLKGKSNSTGGHIFSYH